MLDKIKNYYENNKISVFIFLMAFYLFSQLYISPLIITFLSLILFIDNKKVKSIFFVVSVIVCSIISRDILFIAFESFGLILLTIASSIKDKINLDVTEINKVLSIPFLFLFFSDITSEFPITAIKLTLIERNIINDKFVCILIIVALLLIYKLLFKNNVFIYMITSIYYLLCITNYWVYNITNHPFNLQDILLLETVNGVMNNVDVDSTQILHFIPILFLMILSFIYIFKLKIQKINFSLKPKILTSLCSIALIIVCTGELSTWLPYHINNVYKNGIMSYLSVNFSILNKPSNYEKDIKTIEKIIDDNKEDQIEKNNNEDKPIIICIMNEAFSDLSVVSNTFKTSAEYIPFTKSMMTSGKSGYVYSSVFGNNTVSSEFEFLTGIPTGLALKGSNIYNTYLKENTESIVSLLETNGYKTIGVHPYTATGYKRLKAWNKFGFDETYFIDSFELKEETMVRKYISDEEFYNRIIDLYNKNKENPLFIYGISMQNHATYNEKDIDITIRNENGDFSEVDTYLTLSNISDNALKKLIDFFNKEDKKVVIMYYGDHQPMIDHGFYETLLNKKEEDFTEEEKLLMYKIPYFVHSNYETNNVVPETTSMCYLPSILLDYAGIDKDAWFNKNYELSKKYPLLTELYIKADNKLNRLSEDIVNDSKELSLIKSWGYQRIIEPEKFMK